jgi:hypothetical protein
MRLRADETYQTSRIASTWSSTTACEARSARTSSSPNSALFFISSNSASVSGERAAAPCV